VIDYWSWSHHFLNPPSLSISPPFDSLTHIPRPFIMAQTLCRSLFFFPKKKMLLLRCSLCMGLCLLEMYVASPDTRPRPSVLFFCIVVGAWLERSLVWGRRWLPPSASRKASVRLPRHAHEHMVALSRTSQNPFLTGRVLSWENQNACFGKLWLLFLSRIPEPFTIDELRPPPPPTEICLRYAFEICLKICFRVILYFSRQCHMHVCECEA
jgi:hypothetical protein